jgi:hypothetical protein
MRRTAALLLLIALFAGCASPDASPDTTAEDILIDANRPAPTFGQVVTGPAVGPDFNATTAAVPRLVEGEWWRIRFSSQFASAAGATEFVRVVANATEEGYIFGMPHEGWYKEAIAYHAPAFGDVALNLSYRTHNVWFEPLRFPLRTGETWTTYFAASPFKATVESADKHLSTIRFDSIAQGEPTDPVFALMFPSGGSMRATYDAQQHEIVRMESFVGVWEVVEHGYGFEGWVTVPRGEHTAIDYGTFGPAEPGKPVLKRTVAVEGGFNRLTMMHAIFGLSPGSYRIVSIDPSKKEFKTEAVGAQSMALKFYESNEPDGTWQQEDFVAGVGGTYSMGIAYHQFDINLPDQQRRSDHSHAVVR